MTARTRRLSPLRRLLLAGEILAAYVEVRGLLRRRTLPETVDALRRGGRQLTAGDASPVPVGRHLAWATVRTITLLPADSRCLMRSLVLTRVLAHRGIHSTVVLSAAPGPDFEAHAWVELAGEPLLAPAGTDHQQLIRL
jgi:hypothetical protein